MDKKTVWCVFSPQGHQAPKFQHDSEASAKAEAKRLARRLTERIDGMF